MKRRRKREDKQGADMFANKSLLLGILLVLPLVSALPIYSRPIISGSTQTNSTFDFVFNFTTNADCTGVVLSNASTLTTNAAGDAFININVSGISTSTIPSYICEYRNGTLRMTHIDSDQIFRELYVHQSNTTKAQITNASIDDTLTVRGNTYSSIFKADKTTDYVSIGGQPRSGSGEMVHIQQDTLNPNTVSPVTMTKNNVTINQSGTRIIQDVTIIHDETINTGITDNGTRTNLYVQAYRNSQETAGTLEETRGIDLQFGHRLTNQSAQTNLVKGIHLRPIIGNGTITDLYAIYLADWTTGGNLNNSHGILIDIPPGNNLTRAIETRRGDVIFNSNTQNNGINYNSTANTLCMNCTSAANTLTVNGTTGFLDTVTLTQMTLGSILFTAASGVISQNNTFLYWDNANSILRLPSINATNNLTVNGSSVCLSDGTNCQATTTPNTTTSNGTLLTTSVNGNEIKITVATSVFDEAAQDAVGNILKNSTTVNFLYNDPVDTIIATVIGTAGWAFNTSSGLGNDSSGRGVFNRTVTDSFYAPLGAASNSTVVNVSGGGPYIYDNKSGGVFWNDTIGNQTTNELINAVATNKLNTTDQRYNDTNSIPFTNSTTQVYLKPGYPRRFNFTGNTTVDGINVCLQNDSNCPVDDMGGGWITNISSGIINDSSGALGYNLTLTNDIASRHGNTSEQIQDAIGSVLTDTGTVDLVYDDAGNTISANSLGNTSEQMQDAVGAIITNGSGINAAYDDSGNRIVIATTGDNNANQSFNDTSTIPFGNSTSQTFLKTGYPAIINLTHVQVNVSNMTVNNLLEANGNVSFKQPFEKEYPGFVFALSAGTSSTPTHTNGIKTIPTATAVTANFSIHLDVPKTIAGSSFTIRNVTWSFALPAGVTIRTKRLYVLDVFTAQITNIYNNGTHDNVTSVNHSASGLPYVIDSNRQSPALMLDLEISGPGGIGQSLDFRGIRIIGDTD